MNRTEKSIGVFLSMDDLAAQRTAVHDYCPTLKIVMTLCFLVCVVSFDRYSLSSLCLFFFYPAIVMASGEIPLRPIFCRLLPALPFVLFAGISNIIFERQTALTIFGIGVSYGVLSCVVLVAKTLLCVSAVLLLAATTPSLKLFAALKRLGVPDIFLTVLMLSMRYLLVLLEQVRKMTVAYHLRSKKLRGIELKHMGSFTGQLLLLSFDRADRVYTAMKCRGYGEGSLLGHFAGATAGQITVCVLVCAAMTAARLFPLELIIGLVNL